MIVVECQQGSPEWFEARAGVITASTFAEIRKRPKSGPNKGGFSAEAQTLAFRLAIERISGKPLDEGFSGWAAQRGHELEPIARMHHEALIGLAVNTAGFVKTDDSLFGASADGLIGEDGGAEYKCLIAPDRLRTVYLDGNLSEFMDQIQGCMWITGRKWWHFGLYCPAMESIGKQFWHREIERDDDYIEALEADLLAFEKLVSEYESKLRSA
jgi:hypothetical protein